MKKGVFAGTWDLLHAGHIYALAEAKKRCEHLTVCVKVNPHTDAFSVNKKNKPIQSIFERWTQLAGCKFVDTIIPYESEHDLRNIYATLDFDVRFLGGDYLDIQDKIIGSEMCATRQKETVFIMRRHDFSTTELRTRCGMEYYNQQSDWVK